MRPSFYYDYQKLQGDYGRFHVGFWRRSIRRRILC